MKVGSSGPLQELYTFSGAPKLFFCRSTPELGVCGVHSVAAVDLLIYCTYFNYPTSHLDVTTIIIGILISNTVLITYKELVLCQVVVPIPIFAVTFHVLSFDQRFDPFLNVSWLRRDLDLL
jgi:hypothetical protein